MDTAQNLKMLSGENFGLITLSESAHTHFLKLLSEQPTGTNLRVFAIQPGTPEGDVGLCFCLPGEEQPDDLRFNQKNTYDILLAADSQIALRDLKIDFTPGPAGGELAVTAPYLRGEAQDRPASVEKPNIDASIFEKIEYIIHTEINPALAAHRGAVKLMAVTEELVVQLEFAGGCQGCGMATVTLQQGIEKTLRTYFPDITRIEDVTEHSAGKNPYF